MSQVLFLGNSHVSAFKLAYDEIKEPKLPECAFFCARGADLAFTEVGSNHLRSTQKVALDEEEIRYAYPDMRIEELLQLYAIQQQPMEEVRSQFVKTGGTEAVDLSDVAAIFYVVGVSPYDFIRLRETIAPLSRSLRRRLLERMLRDRFLLRRQIENIRQFNPTCRHFYIGAPLRAAPQQPTLTDLEIQIVIENRHVVASVARDFLFEDVYMPTSELLDESLLATQARYAVGGRQESADFQKEGPTHSDISHMNRDYGKQVFRAFVEPHLEELSSGTPPTAV